MVLKKRSFSSKQWCLTRLKTLLSEKPENYFWHD